MTEQDLKQLRYLETEINLLQQEYDGLAKMLSEVTDTVSGSEPNYPYLKRAITIKGLPFELSDAELAACRPQLAALAEQIAQYKQTYIALRHSLTEQIAGIPDSELRLILSLRFLEVLPWKSVAARIGGNATEESVKKCYQRFLKSRPQCPESR